ncbi:MAG: hypothetical protein ACRENE_03745 [Polyangiaceae bacterium]
MARHKAQVFNLGHEGAQLRNDRLEELLFLVTGLQRIEDLHGSAAVRVYVWARYKLLVAANSRWVDCVGNDVIQLRRLRPARVLVRVLKGARRAFDLDLLARLLQPVVADE